MKKYLLLALIGIWYLNMQGSINIDDFMGDFIEDIKSGIEVISEEASKTKEEKQDEEDEKKDLEDELKELLEDLPEGTEIQEIRLD